MTRYRLLAVDVDGTLVGADQQVSPAHAAALRRARQAGLAVCLCTGRRAAQTRPVWQQCALPGRVDPLICCGGSLVCEPDTGRTLHLRGMDPRMAAETTELLRDLGHSVTAAVDAWRWGFDYYLLDGDDRAAWQDWFSRYPCAVRPIDRLPQTPGAPDLLRLLVLVNPPGAETTMARLRERFGQRLEMVHIFAPNYGAHVLECFAGGVTKWSALAYVAQGLRLPARDIVAVGDDVNDLPMIRRAGLGVAMGNAAPTVRDAADCVIDRHDRDGLAEFVDRLLAGEFD